MGKPRHGVQRGGGPLVVHGTASPWLGLYLTSSIPPHITPRVPETKVCDVCRDTHAASDGPFLHAGGSRQSPRGAGNDRHDQGRFGGQAGLLVTSSHLATIRRGSRHPVWAPPAARRDLDVQLAFLSTRSLDWKGGGGCGLE